MIAYDPQAVRVGDWLVMKPDYDKRIGRHTVQVLAIFSPCRSQSGIALVSVVSAGRHIAHESSG